MELKSNCIVGNRCGLLCSLFWDLNFRLDQRGRKHPIEKEVHARSHSTGSLELCERGWQVALKTGKTGVILITIDFEWNFSRPLPDPNDQKWFRKIVQIRSINCILHRHMIICKIGAQLWRQRSSSSPTGSWWNAKIFDEKLKNIRPQLLLTIMFWSKPSGFYLTFA